MDTLIRPIYSVQPNEDRINLGFGPIELSHNGKNLQGTGKTALKLQPRLRLSIDTKFSISTPDIFVLLSAGRTVEVNYGLNFSRIKATITNINTGSSSSEAEATLLPNPQRMVFSKNSKSRIAHLIFHIVNFPDFLNPAKASGDLLHAVQSGGWKRLGRTILNSQQWQIEIQELPETKSKISRLTEKGGYDITHVGQLTRKDGKSFTAQAAEKAIQNLYLFLSFVRGAWTPPILCVGYDGAGDRVYEDWGVRLGTPWEYRQGWFDVHHADCLSILYPKFLSLLHHRDLGKAATNALYWYLRSNRGGDGAGIDSGIILSQAALERLSSTYLNNFSSVKIKKSNAAVILREALGRLGIPLQIPDVLANLVEHKKKGLWDDGPEAITRVRNELVHPKERLPIKIGHAIPDAWNLAQWYIELIILRLSNYTGTYSNRLAARWVGEVENVPWARKSENKSKQE